MSHKLDAEGTPWTDFLPGARFQRWSGNGRRIRILEVRPEFVEPDWCGNGHILFVIAGELEFDFPGGVERFKAGDGIVLPPGEGHKARALTAVVRLFVVDDET